jgi:hypothetical protein
VSSTHLGPKTRFLLLSDSCWFVDVELSFTVAAGPRQRSHSGVRIPRDLLPYLTVSNSRLPQPGGSGPRIPNPQEQGGPFYTLRHWLPFSSPPTTRRATVEVFKPVCTQAQLGVSHRIYKNPVRTSQETHSITTAETSRLMLFGGKVAVYCENHTEHINTLCGQNAETLYVRMQSVPHRKHYVSATDPNRLMLFAETGAVYCEYRNRLPRGRLFPCASVCGRTQRPTIPQPAGSLVLCVASSCSHFLFGFCYV